MAESNWGTIAAVAGAGIALCGLLIGGGYKLGYDTGEKDYEVNKDFGKSLPPMMVDLKRLAADLANSTEMADENKRLKGEDDANIAELKELRQKAQEQADENKTQSKTIAALKDQVSAIFPTTVITKEIAIDSAEDVIPNVLTIGVDNIMTIAKDAYVRINSDGVTLEVGESKNVPLAGRTCIVKLVNMKEKSLTFTVACSPSSQ